ncbi:MAG: VacJ family lipoprotein [Sulfurospirillum sp.]|nr:VacJ family lipoprotein [Sulfurospirillum sp.]
MRFLLGALLIVSFVFAQNFDDEFAQESVKKDNLRPYNVFMTDVNDKVFTYVLRPFYEGYTVVVPQNARIGISNFFSNLKFPISFINNLLQLKFENSFIELQRFLINTTFGIVGFMDVAKDQFDIKAKNEDFGQTLGYYGIGDSPYIVLPLLGPSNLRDIVGMGGDYYASPLSYIEGRGNLLENNDQAIYAKTGDRLNEGSFYYKKYEAIQKDAFDLYIVLKNAYEQKREREIQQ